LPIPVDFLDQVMQALLTALSNLLQTLPEDILNADASPAATNLNRTMPDL
jgi:hypothetical protein